MHGCGHGIVLFLFLPANEATDSLHFISLLLYVPFFLRSLALFDCCVGVRYLACALFIYTINSTICISIFVYFSVNCQTEPRFFHLTGRMFNIENVNSTVGSRPLKVEIHCKQILQHYLVQLD